MITKGSHFLSADQFLSKEELIQFFKLTKSLEIISRREKRTRILGGAVLANLFFEPSTRTRISFGTAFNLLGGDVRDIFDSVSTSMVKGESIYDTSRIISGYTDIMVTRHPQVGSAQQFAAASIVPVINGGDGVGEHPTQGLLDVYTIIKECRKGDPNALHGLSICIVGDLKHGRTVHSLCKLYHFQKIKS